MSLLGLDVFVARWRLASAESVLAAQDRLELAQLEWKEQKRHWFKLMGLVLAVLALAVLSLVVFSMALIIQFWDTPQRSLVARSIGASDTLKAVLSAPYFLLLLSCFSHVRLCATP